MFYCEHTLLCEMIWSTGTWGDQNRGARRAALVSTLMVLPAHSSIGWWMIRSGRAEPNTPLVVDITQLFVMTSPRVSCDSFPAARHKRPESVYCF